MKLPFDVSRYQARKAAEEAAETAERKRLWHRDMLEYFKDLGLAESQGWAAYKEAGPWIKESNFADFLKFAKDNPIPRCQFGSHAACDRIGLPPDSLPRRQTKIAAALAAIWKEPPRPPMVWAVTSSRYFDNSVDLWVIDIKRDMPADDDPYGVYIHASDDTLNRAVRNGTWLGQEGMVRIL